MLVPLFVPFLCSSNGSRIDISSVGNDLKNKWLNQSVLPI
jgi:hypothetical protein